VHSLEELQVLDALTFECAIGAARIADLFAGQFVSNPIGDSRGRDTDKIVSLASAFNAGTADTIELLERFRNLGSSFGSFCKSASSVARVPSARRLQTGPTRCGFTAIGKQTLDPDSRVARGKFLQQFPGSVFAAVVGDHYFVLQLERVH